jgi:S-adenosylmethionine/arginine decarboxylase-like enzyme
MTATGKATREAYGWELQLDLYGCSALKIDDPEVIREYVTGLVKAIDMKTYGPLLLEHFGHDDPKTAGYSFVQLIETSNLSGHFSPHLRAAYINVFSCRTFSRPTVVAYSMEHFRATECRQKMSERW